MAHGYMPVDTALTIFDTLTAFGSRAAMDCGASADDLARCTYAIANSTRDTLRVVEAVWGDRVNPNVVMLTLLVGCDCVRGLHKRIGRDLQLSARYLHCNCEEWRHAFALAKSDVTATKEFAEIRRIKKWNVFHAACMAMATAYVLEGLLAKAVTTEGGIAIGGVDERGRLRATVRYTKEKPN